MSGVTGKAPIGHLPIDGGPNGGYGLTVWECDECFALINNPEAHSEWHAEKERTVSSTKIIALDRAINSSPSGRPSETIVSRAETFEAFLKS